MIDKAANPVGWALFLDELADAHEHLGELIKSASASADYSEAELSIDLGHVYAHLNRAWYRRNVGEDFPEAEWDAAWDAATQFPRDLKPIA